MLRLPDIEKENATHKAEAFGIPTEEAVVHEFSRTSV
jgi:hypothetical protein